MKNEMKNNEEKRVNFACVWIGRYVQSMHLCFFSGSYGYCSQTHKSQQNIDFWVNLGPTTLFTHLKIILL